MNTLHRQSVSIFFGSEPERDGQHHLAFSETDKEGTAGRGAENSLRRCAPRHITRSACPSALCLSLSSELSCQRGRQTADSTAAPSAVGFRVQPWLWGPRLAC